MGFKSVLRGVGFIFVSITTLVSLFLSDQVSRSTLSLMSGDFYNPAVDYTTPLITTGRTKSLVCVVGNAETIDLADEVAQRLGSFPSAWACWNDDDLVSGEQKLSSSFVVSACRKDCHWARGVEVAVALARKHFDCEYFFLADDDSEYSLANDGSKDPDAIREELVRVLDRYKPAVAALPWPYGHNTSVGMQRINELYMDNDVSPLTGFDNGNLIFHHSIVGVFVPPSPRGEGGWWGNWTLPATYLQMMIPPLFKQNAIEIRTLQYKNGINLNNGVRSASYVKDGLFYTDTSRHPYEFPLKKKYEKFLLRGYKAGERYGPQLLPEDVDWIPQLGEPPYDKQILERMNAVYDLEHPAVAEKAYFVNATTWKQRLEVRRNTTYTVKLLVFTYNRVSSLKRLIRSLQNAYYKGPDFVATNVALVIHIDYSEDQATMVEYAESVSWPFGPKQIVIRKHRLGLKNSIVQAWTPKSMDEYAVFLEDDVEVSPYYFHWIHAGLTNFFYGDTGELNPKLLGISLYQPIWSQVNSSWFSVDNGNKPFIMQVPCSWGALYFPRPWLTFGKWMREFKGDDWDLQIPDSLTNRWPGSASWKKFMIRKMIDEKWYMIYPNLPGNLTLSTNHLGIGENDRLKGPQLQVESAKYTLTLLDGKHINASPRWLQDWFAVEELKVFNFYHQEVESLDEFVIDHSHFEKFTIIVPTFNRTDILVQTLAHYSVLPNLDRIIIVWNNIGMTPPKLPKMAVPVKFQAMEKNALSNRFTPFENIRTSAILSVDDDMRIDLDDVTRGFQAWQRNCFQLVGWAFATRGAKKRDGALVYDNYVPTIDEMKGSTIVLTGAAFFHAKYLRHYSMDPSFSEIRNIVERLHNCEDIGFNFMVASLTRLPPIVLDGWFNKELNSGVEGLWKKPGHFDKRSLCINELTAVYGKKTLIKVKPMIYPLRGETDISSAGSGLAVAQHKKTTEVLKTEGKLTYVEERPRPSLLKKTKVISYKNAERPSLYKAKSKPISKSTSKSTSKKTSIVLLFEIPEALLLAAEKRPEFQKRVDRIKKWQGRENSLKVVGKLIAKAMEALEESDIGPRITVDFNDVTPGFEADIPTPVDSLARKQTIPKQPVKEIQVDTKFPSTQLVLLRAIGNPLPPRHDSGQAFNNLKFTLENEYEYPHLEKRWVLNRLVDEDLVTRLTDLMESHGQKYTVIPFNLTEYDEVQYRFDYYNPGGDVVHSLKYATRALRYPVDEAVNQDKNVYVTNQNAARNTMLELGQAYAGVDWVLPWDGNCFLHPSAYQEIYQKLQAMLSTHKYAITPMNRATTNEEVLEDFYSPKPIEEPQVIFHKTATGRFHPLLRYGRRNKVEFLQRLKIKGPWDAWPPLYDYETKHLGPFFLPLPDLQQDEPTKEVGWVTRLSSGKEHLERDGSIIARGLTRFEGITSILGKLDTRAVTELHGYRAGQLIYYDEESLVRDRQLYKDGNMRIKSVVEELLHLAHEAVSAGPWSVMDKPDDSVAVSGDKHDYFHLPPYYWPTSTEEGTDPNNKWQRRDEKLYPGTELNEEGSEKFDRTRVKDFHYNTTILGLAYFMTGEKQYAEVAAQNVRTWFLDPETRMNPNMKYAQVTNGHSNNIGSSFGIIEMKDLYFMLDAVHLIERDGFLTEKEQNDLRAWLTEYLDWLENSEIGTEEYSQKNNHGLYFDVQAVAIASFINDTAKMIWYIERSTSRLLAQSMGDGSMPQELSRPTCEHYQMFTLQGWSVLSRMAQTVNRNLWIDRRSNGMSPLCRVAKYAIPSFGREKKCEKSEELAENVTRWWPLLQDSTYYCPSLRNQDQYWPIVWFPKDSRHPPGSSYDMPNLFDPHDGIAPFWNLGLVHGNLTWSSSIATTKPKQ